MVEISSPPSSVLIVRLGAIGDVLRVLPAARRIRRDLPHAKIGWAVDRRVYPALAGNPNVDRFHILERDDLAAGPVSLIREFLRFRRELREERYDIALDFHGRLRSGVTSRLSGAPARIGYAAESASEGNHFFNNIHVRLTDPADNRVLRFLELLSPLGLDTNWEPSETGVYVSPELRKSAERWYDETKRPEVAVYPGCSTARLRERWPEEKWIDLLGRLGELGLRSVVFWGPDEHAMCHRIAAATGSSSTLAPPTPLLEMMAMIGLFRAFVGSDTSAMHMAWMQGVPTAVFIGPKEPRITEPLDPVPHRVLRATEFFRSGVRPSYQAAEIISAVAVDDALEAVCDLVGSKRNGGARTETKEAH
jgi:ADP-heptose:LPS heptosyltransferase